VRSLKGVTVIAARWSIVVKNRSILRVRALSVVQMPRQRDARISVEERRVRRFLLLGTATTATTAHIG
jgi:hypothetical protein